MTDSPLVIVGIGGSGTRVFARLAEAAGRFMGANQNVSNDALSLYSLADKWCEPVYRAWQSGDRGDWSEFAADLAVGIERHLDGLNPGTPWGWKQPRSIHLLPALIEAYPDLLLLHVLRDGRDVAFGGGIHLCLTGAYSVSEATRQEPNPMQLADLWSTANCLAADFGESRLGKRYLRVRLEDLCDNANRVAGEVADFAGGDISRNRLENLVQAPKSRGRWREADLVTLSKVTTKAQSALRRFGYMQASLG